MIRHLMFLAIALPLAAADDEPKPDLLRLTNGELEGRFGGIDERGVLRWEREDGIAPMEFKTDKVRQIVLRGGHPTEAGMAAAHLELVNGDRLPARIVSLDKDTFTLDTPMAGPLAVPRDSVASAAPNPFGGRLLYAGPFSDAGWEVFRPSDDFADAEEDEAEPAGDAELGEDGDDEAETEERSWNHSGSKWYYANGRDALRNPIDMPDQAVLRFTLEWRSRPPIAIAFHADFEPPVYPEPAEGEELSEEELEKVREERETRRRNSQHFADYFGNAYVLTLRSSYAQLQHCGFNDDGQPFVNQVRSSSANIRFDDTGSSTFEIRTNRLKGNVSLFVNGEFSMQWDVDQTIEGNGDPDEVYAARGGGIAFRMLGSNTPIRISDIVVAEWNGMPDSARSLKSDEFDVVLLTNGTDRFSGKVTGIEDGRLTLEGRYAPLVIPLEEVAEVHFAGDSLKEVEDTRDRMVRVHFEPVGQISGIVGATGRDAMELESPLLGRTRLDLESAVILEFQSGSSFLNYWDEDL